MKTFAVPLLPSILTIAVLGALAIAPHTASAQEEVRYITDKLYVPLRSGKSQNHRIIHKGLPSGTEVSILEVDEAAGYSLIRTRRGLEGWIISRYLDRDPVAEVKLAQANARLQQLETENEKLKKAFTTAAGNSREASSTITDLESENQRLQKELDEIKRISANAIKLDQDYQVLSEAKQMLRDKVDVLETENTRLREKQENEAFLNGAFAVILGILAAVIIPRLKPRKRSEWI